MSTTSTTPECTAKSNIFGFALGRDFVCTGGALHDEPSVSCNLSKRTRELCHHHIPAGPALETWMGRPGTVQEFDFGTIIIFDVQPPKPAPKPEEPPALPFDEEEAKAQWLAEEMMAMKCDREGGQERAARIHRRKAASWKKYAEMLKPTAYWPLHKCANHNCGISNLRPNERCYGCNTLPRERVVGEPDR